MVSTNAISGTKGFQDDLILLSGVLYPHSRRNHRDVLGYILTYKHYHYEDFQVQLQGGIMSCVSRES